MSIPSPVPVVDPDTEGFWAAATAGTLSIARCSGCRRWQHPPTETCRWCNGAVAFEPVSGLGTVFSFILVRQVTVPGHEAPYVVAVVELDESPDVRLAGIVQGPVEEVSVGMRVEAVLVDIPGTALKGPEFRALPS